jgi:hypothetical protein
MKTNDLGSKKMNNKETDTTTIPKDNAIENTMIAVPKLNSELEIDANGNQRIVTRARQTENEPTHSLKMEDSVHLENENETRGVSSDLEVQKTIENKDRNSDITKHRYPNSNADNYENRGNLKMDNES